VGGAGASRGGRKAEGGGAAREGRAKGAAAAAALPAVFVAPPQPPPQPPAAPATLAEAVARARDLTGRLLNELDAVTAHPGELAREIEAETAGDATAARRTAMMRAIGLPSRSLILKTLTGAMREWAAIERAGTGPITALGKKTAAEAAARAPAPAGSPWDLLDDDAPDRPPN
jgi:hypothetical protein